MLFSINKQITCTIRKTSSRGFTNSVKLHHALPSRCTPKRNFTSNLPRFLVWDTQIGVRHLSLTAPGRNLSDGPSLHSVAFVASEAKLENIATEVTNLPPEEILAAADLTSPAENIITELTNPPLEEILVAADLTSPAESTVVSEEIIVDSVPLSNEGIANDFFTPETNTVQEISQLPSENLSAVTDTFTSSAPPMEFISIPEPPSIPIPTETISVVNSLSEPPFSDLDLGGYTPAGLIESALEWLHIGADLPWWICIVLGTVTIRTLLFPLVVKSQRHNAKVANNSPQMQVLQKKMTEARQSGNAMLTAQMTNEMQIFMKEKDINPFKGLILPLVQAPIFISVFIALRSMASAPVESFKTGGLFCFTDLTVCDPYYVLPILTSATLFLSIEMGTNTAQMNAQNMGLMKYFLRALPVVMFPFIMHFPAALTLYWFSANVITGAQVALFKVPKVRDYFQIEARRNFESDQMEVLDSNKKKGFRQSATEAWNNMKIINELEERKKFSELKFKQAGHSPVQKTYKYDPTKQTAQQIVKRIKGPKRP